VCDVITVIVGFTGFVLGVLAMKGTAKAFRWLSERFGPLSW
jgi:hypothetical protein